MAADFFGKFTAAFTGKPPVVASPPETEEQKRERLQREGFAALLIRRAGLNVAPYNKYNAQLLPSVVELLPDRTGHTDAQLINMASHTCTKTWVTRAMQILDQQVERFTSSGASSEDISNVVQTNIKGIAQVLVEGFDVVEKKKFTYDANGKITGYTDTRGPECNVALARGESLMGGKKRRKTKKRTKKTKKTLRRK